MIRRLLLGLLQRALWYINTKIHVDFNAPDDPIMVTRARLATLEAARREQLIRAYADAQKAGARVEQLDDDGQALAND